VAKCRFAVLSASLIRSESTGARAVEREWLLVSIDAMEDPATAARAAKAAVVANLERARAEPPSGPPEHLRVGVLP
jgi:hypothetical protein